MDQAADFRVSPTPLAPYLPALAANPPCCCLPAEAPAFPAKAASSPAPPSLRFEEVARYANETIRHRVNRLLGRFGFTSQDREDLEADLRAHLISRLSSYRPERGAQTSFVAEVLLNRTRRLIEARKASRRWIPIGLSLDETVEDEDGMELDRSEAFDHDDYLLRSNRAARPAQEAHELRLDVEKAVRALPPDLADLCRRLLTQTVRQVCDETGVPKSTVHYRMVRIRRLFEKQGLRSYVGSSPSFSAARR